MKTPHVWIPLKSCEIAHSIGISKERAVTIHLFQTASKEKITIEILPSKILMLFFCSKQGLKLLSNKKLAPASMHGYENHALINSVIFSSIFCLMTYLRQNF